MRKIIINLAKLDLKLNEYLSSTMIVFSYLGCCGFIVLSMGLLAGEDDFEIYVLFLISLVFWIGLSKLVKLICTEELNLKNKDL